MSELTAEQQSQLASIIEAYKKTTPQHLEIVRADYAEMYMIRTQSDQREAENMHFFAGVIAGVIFATVGFVFVSVLFYLV